MLFSVPNTHLVLSMLSFFRVSLCCFMSSGMKLQSLFTQSVGWPACSFEYGASVVNANARNSFKVQPPAAVGVQMVKNPSAHINSQITNRTTWSLWLECALEIFMNM